MRVDLHGIDPWAAQRPRRRDWLAAGLGGLLLGVGGLAQWQSVTSSGAVAGLERVDASAWQSMVDRSHRLNRVLADLSQPWSRWLERSLAVAGADVRFERLDGLPADRRLELVVVAPELGRAGTFADALRALPGAVSAQIVRHEATAGGMRVYIEVRL